jgi:CBS domain-containing protein
VITIEPEESVAKAASMMANKKIGVLPVTRAGKLAGIITAPDILKAFAKHCKDI